VIHIKRIRELDFVYASFDGRKWIQIGYMNPKIFFGTPQLSEMYPDDRKWLLGQLLKTSGNRHVNLCPLPKDQEMWTGDDSTTSRTVDLFQQMSRVWAPSASGL